MLDLAREQWTVETWPGRSRATCHAQRDAPSVGLYFDQWCTECVIQAGQRRGAFRFFPDVEGRTCTLQEIRVSLGPGTDGALLAIEAAVDPLLGKASVVSGPGAFEWDQRTWRSIHRWSGPDDLAYLHLDDSTSGQPLTSLSFLWRRSPLLDMEAGLPDGNPGADWDARAV